MSCRRQHNGEIRSWGISESISFSFTEFTTCDWVGGVRDQRHGQFVGDTMEIRALSSLKLFLARCKRVLGTCKIPSKYHTSSPLSSMITGNKILGLRISMVFLAQ